MQQNQSLLLSFPAWNLSSRLTLNPLIIACKSRNLGNDPQPSVVESHLEIPVYLSHFTKVSSMLIINLCLSFFSTVFKCAVTINYIT